VTGRPKIRLAIFDCDGTLLDGQAAVCSAMRGGFEAVGLAVPPDHEIRRIVGLSLVQAIRRLAPDADAETHDRAVEAYRASFFAAREAGAVHEPVYDGVRELLNDLHGAGWTLGVATGKTRRGLDGGLAMHGLAHLFATLQTSDLHPSKPHPSMIEAALAETGAAPADTAMIGDTAYDIEMAVAAGVRPIGVAWGYHTPDELLAAGAEAVAENAAHLGALLDGR
jgi:phosphoglycolate phosphatase